MAGYFMVAEKEGSLAEAQASALIGKAREIAKATNVVMPVSMTYSGMYGVYFILRYTSNNVRECVRAAIQDLGYEILVLDHCGRRTVYRDPMEVIRQSRGK